jgi:hypothetical protein
MGMWACVRMLREYGKDINVMSAAVQPTFDAIVMD